MRSQSNGLLNSRTVLLPSGADPYEVAIREKANCIASVLSRYCHSGVISYEDCEEILNDWLYRSLKVKARFEHSTTEELYGFLFTVARNLVRSRFRDLTARKRDLRLSSPLDSVEDCHSAFTDIAALDARKHVMKVELIQALSECSKRLASQPNPNCMGEMMLEGTKQRDTAELLNITSAAVSQKKKKAIQQLRKSLQEKGWDSTCLEVLE